MFKEFLEIHFNLFRESESSRNPFYVVSLAHVNLADANIYFMWVHGSRVGGWVPILNWTTNRIVPPNPNSQFWYWTSMDQASVSRLTSRELLRLLLYCIREIAFRYGIPLENHTVVSLEIPWNSDDSVEPNVRVIDHREEDASNTTHHPWREWKNPASWNANSICFQLCSQNGLERMTRWFTNRAADLFRTEPGNTERSWRNAFQTPDRVETQVRAKQLQPFIRFSVMCSCDSCEVMSFVQFHFHMSRFGFSQFAVWCLVVFVVWGFWGFR